MLFKKIVFFSHLIAYLLSKRIVWSKCLDVETEPHPRIETKTKQLFYMVKVASSKDQRHNMVAMVELIGQLIKACSLGLQHTSLILYINVMVNIIDSCKTG